MTTLRQILGNGAPHPMGSPENDAVRERIEIACEHFVDLRRNNDREIAERIRADRIDLLIDLKGYTREVMRRAVLADGYDDVIVRAWLW